MRLERYPALVLNADFRPQALFPLSTKDAWETIKNVYEGTISVVAEYAESVRSPGTTMRIPSVVALRTYRPPLTRVAFKPENVFLRDRYRCQYCGGQHRKLTKDHVIPVSKGGQDVWQNVVASCDPCNNRKGDSIGMMHPMKVPREPTPAEMHALERSMKRLHPTWLDYLPAEAA